MITEKAYAKVNLFLNVLGKRKDGYHDLEMINAKIDLYDTVTIEQIDVPGMAIIVSNDLFLSNQNNIVHDVATHMARKYLSESGIKVSIDKKIPFGAGLAGNSADAAAIIKGVNHLFNLELTFSEMVDIALLYGADIPYCLIDAPALVEGIGEKITPISVDWGGYCVLLVHPKVYVATQDIFTLGDKKGFDEGDFKAAIKSLKDCDISLFVSKMHNALQHLSLEANPAVADAFQCMGESLGTEGIIMTGSGSTLIKLFQPPAQAVDEFIAKYCDRYFINIYKFL
jgi:4-diphosphocytidyl-2-C-methyl-D-erythritol kinase